MSREVRVGDLGLGGSNPLFLIAGPCVVEDLETTLDIGRRCRDVCRKLDVPYVFKSSYDKANRTSLKSFRGPGLEHGLDILRRIKDELEVPVLIDVHSQEEVELASQVADILQIPAFLCRQTDFVRAVAEAGRPVNVKKGQFLTPWDVASVVEKIEDAGNYDIVLTERGACFGYNNLVVDFRAFPVMAATGYPVIFDATHSVQLPGGKGDASGGQREFVEPLARAAVAAGVDGIFMEVHTDPEHAPSDADCMFPVQELERLLQTLLAIRSAIAEVEEEHEER